MRDMFKVLELSKQEKQERKTNATWNTEIPLDFLARKFSVNESFLRVETVCLRRKVFWESYQRVF